MKIFELECVELWAPHYSSSPPNMHVQKKPYNSHKILQISLPSLNSIPVFKAHRRRVYRGISSNNSRPSINRLPRIIAPLWRKYIK